MQDTKKTYQVTTLPTIALPRRGTEPVVGFRMGARRMFVVQK